MTKTLTELQPRGVFAELPEYSYFSATGQGASITSLNMALRQFAPKRASGHRSFLIGLPHISDPAASHVNLTTLPLPKLPYQTQLLLIALASLRLLAAIVLVIDVCSLP
jgi:hypothetical protein